MPGIYLYSSNRLETLADIFAHKIQDQPLPPFHKETIILQSRGMERWLALETASRLNIWANCDCPFPNTFVRNIFKLLLPGMPEVSHYDKEYLLWHIMNILPGLMHGPHFDAVAAYLASGHDLKLYQLSHEITDLFDQYTLFRPGMILDWEDETKKVPAAHTWQSLLWRCLVEHLRRNHQAWEHHRARLLQLFEERISDPDLDQTLLPSRVSIFGISSLPPYHLRILTGLAQHIELHFFILNPCREYWFDIIADREMVKISRKETVSPEKLHYLQGNSLLASMGHLGRDFMTMLQEIYTEEHDFFQDPQEDTLLAAIQHDILYLHEHPVTSPEPGQRKKRIYAGDVSLTFHSCHSPMREVETLHDLLLGVFDQADKEERIAPRDVLVMAPEIDDYVPLIRAVFDAPAAKHKKIPYGISDQSIRGMSKFIDTFLDLLLLPNSRFSSIDLMEILAAQAVQNRFDIKDQDLGIIEDWIQQTRTCWGIDQDHKKRLQLPPFRENTWRAGLDRLLLGYAMPGNNQVLFKNVLPYDAIEGNNTALLGNFLNFCQNLFELEDTLRQSHSLAEWSEILLLAKDRLMLADQQTEADDRILKRLLYTLRELHQQTSYLNKVSLDVIRSYLLRSLDEKFSPIAGGTGFLTGGVTFCSMLPMRAIPFKAIYLLGMNDGLYPRSGRRKSFDLMAGEPKRGDRSKRLDDRYLFLETVLSARKRLAISFVGQSIQDGSRRPPSVLVSELMDYIDRGYSWQDNSEEPGAPVSSCLTTLHHLQPFHPGYFTPQTDGGRQKPFSYSTENLEAAQALASGQLQVNPLFSGSLQPPPAALKQIDLHALVRFFSHPARHLLVRIIGIAPVEQSQVLDTSEHFTLKGLARYKLENDILDHLLQQRDCHKLYQVKKAGGELPHGEIGEIYFTRMVTELQSFHRILAGLFTGQEIKKQQVSLDVGDFTVTGQLGMLCTDKLVQYRYGNLQAKDVLRSWISHLVFNGLQDTGDQGTGSSTYYLGKDIIYRYTPTALWKFYLEQLLHLYWQGLTEPLSFFPQSSFIFAEELHRGKNEQEALRKAMAAWEGIGYNSRGEKNDPYNRLCWKDRGLAAPDFMAQAKKVFLPVLEHLEKIQLTGFTPPL